ncbi:MAG TPA: heat-inducible transcriptional repressor HrcA [bacterium]|nr:heat-inducible transcriptional repressor HrcA [bacterium]
MPPTVTLSDRQRTVLRTLVQLYLETGEPVASHDVVEHGQLPFSSATVRAEFAALDEAGYLAKPHAAAGRVPTEAAVRLYAQQLMGSAALPLEERSRIERALAAIRDKLELLLQETSELLYRETGCVGLVVAPPEQWGHIETVRLVALDSRTLILNLVFSWGHVESVLTPLPVEAAKLDLGTIERFLQQELGGNNLYDLDPGRVERALALAKQRSLAHRAVFEPIERFVVDLAQSTPGKVVTSGVTAVAADPAFEGHDQLRVLLRLTQDPGFPPRLFLDMNPARPGVRVRIGREIGGEEFTGLAVVWAPFGRAGDQGGRVGVFGPMRLPYRRAVPLVEHCAALLERNIPVPTRLAS